MQSDLKTGTDNADIPKKFALGMQTFTLKGIILVLKKEGMVVPLVTFYPLQYIFAVQFFLS